MTGPLDGPRGPVRALETARGQALVRADTTALSRMIADNTGSLRGFPFSGRLWYTRIFVKRDGRWQAVAMQHTKIQ